MGISLDQGFSFYIKTYALWQGLKQYFLVKQLFKIMYIYEKDNVVDENITWIFIKHSCGIPHFENYIFAAFACWVIFSKGLKSPVGLG